MGWEEIKEQGYCRGYGGVRDYVSRNLRGKPTPVGPRPPSARAARRRLLIHPGALADACMLTELQGDRPPEWIDSARATTDLPALRYFAQPLERDLDAVVAGLTQPWRSGVVEGHVNRIKMLKREMFGRAGFDLLRKRVLLG